jgi:hypothetical protein
MTLIAPPPAPVKPVLPPRGNGHTPPNGNGRDHGGHDQDGNGGAGGPNGPEEAPQPPRRRRSIWPFLLDLGLVLMLFGLIIIGRFLIVIGAVIFVVALTGWIRDARKDFSGLAD